MRTLSLVGVWRDKKIVQIARRCAWCRRYDSTKDFALAHNGAQISHGICPKCSKKFLAELDLPPNAA